MDPNPYARETIQKGLSSPIVNEIPAFSVGNVPIYGDLILAPLAGYSDQPYRCICRRLGSAMSYTQFVSANGFLHGDSRTRDPLRFDPQERPIVFQVSGGDPVPIVEACKRLEELEPDIIDVNMGCPADRICRKGGGAALLREPAKIAHIFSSLTKELSTPVAGKIRLGWDRDSLNYLEVARILEDNGASLVSVHGRTRSENYGSPADWDAIAQVKQSVHIPVLSNGDVRCVEDIQRIKAHTGCDGVMIGRGAIGNPWLFQKRDLIKVSLDERLEMILYHLSQMVTFYGERRGVLSFRKHLVRYLRGLPGASQVRRQLMACITQTEVSSTIERFFTSYPERVIMHSNG